MVVRQRTHPTCSSPSTISGGCRQFQLLHFPLPRRKKNEVPRELISTAASTKTTHRLQAPDAQSLRFSVVRKRGCSPISSTKLCGQAIVSATSTVCRYTQLFSFNLPVPYLIPRSHSYCLSLPLYLEWYNGSITLRVHSGVTKRIQCRLYYRPLNKCVKPLSGV